MARISLSKIIKKNKEITSILQQLVANQSSTLTIIDNKNRIIYGEAPTDDLQCFAIKWNGQFLGKVYGEPSTKPLADLLQFLVNREGERRKLGAEVLDLYREVNFMYQFSQKLAETINPKEIAALTLVEANTLIDVKGGIVVLLDELNKVPIVVAENGLNFLPSGSLAESDLYQHLSAKEAGGILNDYPISAEQVMSILFSPLKVRDKKLGIIILVNETGLPYSAADLKLLSTLSIQSAASIESAQLFEKNIREAREKEAAIRALHKVTSRFVPNEFLKSLGYQEITQVMLGDSVQKEVTVFFSDIRGYTTLSENMTPTENFNFVNAFNGRMGPIIMKNGGFVNQYLGDGIMAIFPYSATDALKAAVEMQQELQLYNQERTKKQRPAIRIGIGLHTGALIMGIIGDENRMDAATISDAVNTAARIESLTKFFGVNILLSGNSLSKIQLEQGDDCNDSFLPRYLGRVQVKGKQKAIRIYECFDGDTPLLKEHKSYTLPKFEVALQHYFSKSFQNASTYFQKILSANHEDNVAKLFLNKSAALALNGVEEGWTGIETMITK